MATRLPVRMAPWVKRLADLGKTRLVAMARVKAFNMEHGSPS